MHSQEPSYYEIALTNRQVLGFFVVLLLCVVGAFFSGIWLGKKQPPVGPRLAQAAALVDADGESQEPLEELNFFTDEQPAKPATAQRRPAAEPRSSETAAKPIEQGAGTTLRQDVEAARSASAPRESSSSPSPPPAPSPRPEPKTAAAATPAAATPLTGFVIQVFSSPDGARARELTEQLRADGYDAFLVEEVIDGRMTHRVRVGPFSSRSEADKVKPGIARAYKVDPWVTQIRD